MADASPAQRYLPAIGLQVYTVRNELEKDLPGTLRVIKAAGYAQVELLRTLNASDIVAHARELELGITSAFMDWASLVESGPESPADLDRTIALGRELALKYLVFGYIGKGARETIAHMKRHAAAANAFGRHCREAGIQLCYHHHSFEFAPLEDGHTTGWEVLLQELDPALVKLEFDVFWVAIAGHDPVRMLHELRGRVAQVHLKDLAAGTPVIHDESTVPPEAFKELGAGCLDLPRILTACAETGVDQCHVEQDQSPAPLTSIAISLRHLRRL